MKKELDINPKIYFKSFFNDIRYFRYAQNHNHNNSDFTVMTKKL